jgi:hypothetical protein
MSRKSRRVWALAAATWFLLLVLFSPHLVKSWKQKKSFDEVFQSYTSALMSRDYARAYELCGPGFKAATQYETFVAQQKTLNAAFGNLRSIEQGQTTVHGWDPRWAAVANVDLIYERGVAKFVLRFENNQGRWVLCGYKQQ